MTQSVCSWFINRYFRHFHLKMKSRQHNRNNFMSFLWVFTSFWLFFIITMRIFIKFTGKIQWKEFLRWEVAKNSHFYLKHEDCVWKCFKLTSFHWFSNGLEDWKQFLQHQIGVIDICLSTLYTKCACSITIATRNAFRCWIFEWVYNDEFCLHFMKVLLRLVLYF